MRLMTLLLLLVSALSALMMPRSQGPKSDGAGRAQELLAQARVAIGGEKLKALQSLSVTGNYRQKMGERDLAGEIELEMILPDKARKSMTMNPMPSVEITRIEAINGETAWTDAETNNTGGGNMVFRTGPPNSSPEMQKAQQQSVRVQFAHLWVGLFLSSPSSFPVEYSYVGEAEAPDGKADVIDLKGPNGFASQLFLDQQTHRPLMLSFKGRQPRMAMRTMTMTAGKPPSPEDLEKRRKEDEAQQPPPPLVEIQIRFADYRTVNGISFPHQISRTVDGELNEDWELTKFKINPAIKPGRFEKKSSS